MSSKKIVLVMELSLASINLNIQGCEQSCFCVGSIHLKLDIQMGIIYHSYDKATQVCNREFLHSCCFISHGRIVLKILWQRLGNDL